MDNRITNLVTDVTEGLKDDPELRLDVQAELASHLEETTCAFAADGMDEEAATEQAIKSFGAPMDIAGALLEANRGRMKLRALARLAIKAVLVPAAVIVAIFIGYGGVVRMHQLYLVQKAITEQGFQESPSVLAAITIPPLPFTTPMQTRLAHMQKRIVGISFSSMETIVDADTRKAYIATQYERWQEHPSDKAYLWNYANSLILNPEMSPDSAAENILSLGKQADPDNAYYPYMRASVLFSKAVTEKSHRDPDTGKYVTDYHISDRRLLDQTMAEWRRGLDKPRYATYHREMLATRLAQLPPARRSEDMLLKMSIVSSEMYHEISRIRALVRFSSHYARLLIEEGRADEALPYLQAWKTVTLHQLENEEWLYMVLSVSSLAKYSSNESASIYESIGRHDLATSTRRDAEALSLAFERHRAHYNYSLFRRLSIFASGFLPNIDDNLIPQEQLAPTRYLEQTLVEEVALNLLLLFLAIALWYAAFVSLLYQLRHRRAGLAPMLLLPSWQHLVYIFGVGIVLPLVLYLVYSRWSGLAGREYSFSSFPPRMLIELALLSGVLALLPVIMAVRIIRRRCLRLGVAVPPGRSKGWLLGIFFLGIVGVLAVDIGILFLETFLLSDWISALPETISAAVDAATISSLGVLDILFLIWFGRRIGLGRFFKKEEWRSDKYGSYHGAVARSLVPIYALTILLLAAIGHTYLAREETKWIQRDHLLVPRAEEGLPTPWEYQACSRLAREMRLGLKEIPTDGYAPRTHGD